jgi:orotate phosphoribosyltransferase
MIADWAQPLAPQLVAGPTTGGILISYEVARLLGVRSIFAETVDGQAGRAFQRGFTIAPRERTLVVDDVLTTGGSVRDVLDAVRAKGGRSPVLVCSSTGPEAQQRFRVPFFACLTLDLPAYDPAACQLCAEGVPLKVT